MANQDQETPTNKIEKLNEATSELSSLIAEAADMLRKVKQIKFQYLTLTCDVYTRIDYPSLMMDTCEKDVKQIVPTAKDVRNMDF